MWYDSTLSIYNNNKIQNGQYIVCACLSLVYLSFLHKIIYTRRHNPQSNQAFCCCWFGFILIPVCHTPNYVIVVFSNTIHALNLLVLSISWIYLVYRRNGVLCLCNRIAQHSLNSTDHRTYLIRIQTSSSRDHNYISSYGKYNIHTYIII